MRAPELLPGHRVVAEPAAIDALVATMPPSVTVLRFAPDEALVLALDDVALDDPHAIVEPETAFVSMTVDPAVVRAHTEWAIPDDRQVSQGAIAGVPAKLTRTADGRALVVVHAAYADELRGRLR